MTHTRITTVAISNFQVAIMGLKPLGTRKSELVTLTAAIGYVTADGS